MRIKWSRSAVRDVEAIALYIARDDRAAAQRWANDVVVAVERLARFPRSGRMVSEIGVEHIREVIFGRYRIIYRLRKSSIVVMTVRHGRQLVSATQVLPE